MIDEPVYNLLLSFIKSRSKVFMFERFQKKCYKDNINWQFVSRFDHYPDDQIVCSICLSEPILPRMDKCGHIFCLSCLINLCKHENSKLVLCPVCKNYNINLSESKRVTLALNLPIKLEDYLKFNLMVKGNQSLFPDHFYKLVPTFPQAPLSTESRSKYTNISIDTDVHVVELINQDIATLKKMSTVIESISGQDIVQETSQFLCNELTDFTNNMYVDEESHSTVEKSLDSFNMLLDLPEQLERFTLFFQCTHGRFVMLEPSQSAIFIKALRPQNPKCYIAGKVAAVRKEKVTPMFISETKLTHLPMGSLVTFVHLNKGTIHRRPLKKKLSQDLLWHYNTINKDKKAMNEMRIKSEAKRAALAKQGKMFTPMVDDSLCGDLKDLSIFRISEDTNPSSFNMCMLGIECVDPDDDYPHTESCRFFGFKTFCSSSEDVDISDDNLENAATEPQRLPSISSGEDCAVEEVTDQPEAVHNTHEDSVRHNFPPEPMKEVGPCHSRVSMGTHHNLDKHNYPPDNVRVVSAFLKPDPFVVKYVVKGKKMTQREEKKRRLASRK